MEQSELPTILASSFSEQELQLMLFEMGVQYDSLPGEGKVDKAREIVEYFTRRNTIGDLVAAMVKKRPNCFQFIPPAQRGLRKRKSPPPLPDIYKGNGEEDYYRYLRDTLHRLDRRTRNLALAVAISVAISSTNFAIVIALIVR